MERLKYIIGLGHGEDRVYYVGSGLWHWDSAEAEAFGSRRMAEAVGRNLKRHTMMARMAECGVCHQHEAFGQPPFLVTL